MTLSIGVDIGQQQDPTALTVVETYRPEAIGPRDWPPLRHRIRWVERLPLGTDYQRVVDRIALVADQAARIGSPMIVLDATGVGRPIVDMLKRCSSASLRAVIFTAGEHETSPEYSVLRVPKRDLVQSLEVVLQARRLEAVPDCPLQADLQAELAAFDFAISASGHDRYEGSRGHHDDLVMALCLAVWWGERQSAGDGWMEYERRVAQYPGLYGPKLGDRLG
ncbi:MAG TPA: hypothetical protein VNF24_07750 [Candidatus Acidoferrales bacterium]|nr:hypothetical protein [Candidatus Micrarchaeaceae archaeon]HVB54069.1 hypothetical protein [Candidatus Acidoferrales bacterium]